MKATKKVYFEMYQNAVRRAQEISQIWGRTKVEILATQLGAIQNQLEVFDRWIPDVV